MDADRKLPGTEDYHSKIGHQHICTSSWSPNSHSDAECPMPPLHTMGCITGEKSRAKGQAFFEQAANKPVSFPQEEQQLNGSNAVFKCLYD